MLIGNASSIYYGDIPLYKAYLGENLVWGKEFITSRNILNSSGYIVGNAVDKRVANAPVTTDSAYLPGPTDFYANRLYWPDWGNDIFDGWGLFYLYDISQDEYIPLNFSSMEESDGVISTDEFIINGKTFNIDYGYPVQGIFKIDISCEDKEFDFVFGMDGNLGSNGSTVNSNLAQEYTLEGESFKLHYNYNYQATNQSENFYTYFVPYEKGKNKDIRSFTKHLYSIDSLSIYSKPVKAGLTVYVAKQANVKEWVLNDLQLGVI